MSISCMPHNATLQSTCCQRQPARRTVALPTCRQQQANDRHWVWSQPPTGSHRSIAVQCRAEPAEAAEPPDVPLPSAENGSGAAVADLGPRDDDVLPDSLTDAIAQASESTVTAMQAGSNKIVAEVLLGEFWDSSSGAVFAEEGDQERFWKLTRRFAENLVAMAEDGTRVRALYPDMGVAAMLKNQWGDPGFAVGSLSDRTPYQEEDDIIIFAAPDPQGVQAARRITSEAVDKTIVMFNPRLASGDVGIGLNVRRMVLDYLGSFTTAYSLRPIGDIGTVFRRYPEPWKVFIEDADLQGRYKLAAERDSRPAGEALDIIIQDALGADSPDDEGSQGLGQQVVRTINSLQRFAKSLTR